MLTSPESSASSAPIIFPVNNRDAAVDGPTKVGRKWVAAIPKMELHFIDISYSELHWFIIILNLYKYHVV